MLTHPPLSNDWVPGGNTEETKMRMKGIGHPTSYADEPGLVSPHKGAPYVQKLHAAIFNNLIITMYQLRKVAKEEISTCY